MNKYHLNYDGNQNNGVVFNEKYNGCMYEGSRHKPEMSFKYSSFFFTEVFSQPSYVIEENGTKRLMTKAEQDEARNMAKNWVQPLGQEGNPTFVQKREAKREEIREAYRKEKSSATVNLFGAKWQAGGLSFTAASAEVSALDVTGGTETVFYDVLNQPHALGRGQMVELVSAIKQVKDDLLAKKQSLMVAIHESRTDEDLSEITW